MSTARCLDWKNATVSLGKVSVPLDGSADDNWLDRFHQARAEAKRTRDQQRLPHLQIELRDGALSASQIPAGEDDSVRELLGALVEAANRKPVVRSVYGFPPRSAR